MTNTHDRILRVHHRKQRQYILSGLRTADGLFRKILRVTVQPLPVTDDESVKGLLLLDGHAHDVLNELFLHIPVHRLDIEKHSNHEGYQTDDDHTHWPGYIGYV